MTVSQKISLSIFLSLLIFAITIVFSQTGLYSQIEKTVYSQAKVQEKQKYLTEISNGCEEYIDEIYRAIIDDENAYLKNHFVESYLKMEPNDGESSNRRRITENLFSQFEGFNGLRIIDDRQNICYSTFYDTDINPQEEKENQKNYLRFKNYADIVSEEKLLSYDSLIIENPRHLSSKMLMDITRNELVISVFVQPKSLSKNLNAIKAATFVFYFDLNSFEKRMLLNKNLRFGERLLPVATMKNTDLYGFVVTQNFENLQDVKNSVLHLWNGYSKDLRNNHFRMENVFEQRDGTILVLLTVPLESKKLNVSGIYNSTLFSLPKEIAIIVYICLFISVQLIIFFILSLKADYSIVIKRRIKRLQYELITQFLDDKNELNWEIVARQIESKKDSFSESIKNSFGKKGRKYSAQIDFFLEKSWEDILSVLKSSSPTSGNENVMNEIKKMLEEIINKGDLHYKADNVKVAPVMVNQPQSEIETAQLVETIEKVESFGRLNEEKHSVIPETVQVYSDTGKMDVSSNLSNHLYEEVKLSEALTTVESDLPTSIEVIDEPEALDDIEEVVMLDDLGEIEVIDELDNLEEIDEIDSAEELDDVEEIDDIEDAEVVDENQVGVKPAKKKAIYYEEDDDTYITSEDFVFPTVLNVFAEELCLGQEYVDYCAIDSIGVDFQIKIPGFGVFQSVAPAEDEEVILECEELNHNTNYSMTEFAASTFVTDLSVQTNETIIETDGVFSIAQDLNYTDVIQDESFKSLVDSVLR